MPPQSYNVSEQPLIEELLVRAERIAEAVQRRWRNNEEVSGHCVMWPLSNPTDQPTIAELPPEGKDRATFLREMAQTTNAYALVLVERKAEALSILFECQKRTRRWTIPLLWQGDVQRLGTPKVEDDTKATGLLWSPSSGRS